MIEDNVIENFVTFLENNYVLPKEIIHLVESYIAVLGEPKSADCEDGYFVEMMWDGEEDDRMLECFIYDEDNVEFVKITMLPKENDDEIDDETYDQEISEDSLMTLKDWLDGYD